MTLNGATAFLELGGTTQTQNGGVVLRNGATIQNGTLSSSGTFAVELGSVSADLAGTGGVSKTTAGTVTFSGVNTYSGATTITAARWRCRAPVLRQFKRRDGQRRPHLRHFRHHVRDVDHDACRRRRGRARRTDADHHQRLDHLCRRDRWHRRPASSGGTQTLSGVNTYSGGTTLTGGTLALSGAGTLGATTNSVR